MICPLKAAAKLLKIFHMCKRPRDFFIKKCKLAFGQILHLSALLPQNHKKCRFKHSGRRFFVKKCKKICRIQKKAVTLCDFYENLIARYV